LPVIAVVLRKRTVLIALLALLARYSPALAEGDAVRTLGTGVGTASPFKPAPLDTKSLPPYDPAGTHIHYGLTLSKEMTAALRAYDSAFKVWGQEDYDAKLIRAYKFSLQSSPAAVIGDFNGDGRPDVYLSGNDGLYSIGVSVLSDSATSYAVLERGKIKIDEIGEWVYIENTKKFRSVFAFLPKGSRYECGSDNITGFNVLKNDGIAIQDFYRDTENKEYFWTQEIRYWDTSKKEFLGCGTRSPDNIMFPAAYTNERDSSAQLPLYDPNGPRLEYSVVLSSVMTESLRSYDPDFMLWEQKDYEPILVGAYRYSLQSIPSAVIGDFNGDKIQDVALLGHNKTHDKRIVVLSKNTRHSVIELLNYPLTDPLFPTAKKGGGNIGQLLELVPAGRKIKAEPAYNRPALNLKNDAFEYGGESGSRLYYYNGSRFVEYALSD